MVVAAVVLRVVETKVVQLLKGVALLYGTVKTSGIVGTSARVAVKALGTGARQRPTFYAQARRAKTGKPADEGALCFSQS